MLGGFACAAPVASAYDGLTQQEIDRAIVHGVAFLKEEQGARGEWTYDLGGDHTLGITALAGLALMENGVEPSDRSIGKAAEVVTTLAKRSEQTYDIALAILFLARAQKGQPGPNDALIRRLAIRLAGGTNEGFWTYNVPFNPETEETGRSASQARTRRPFRFRRAQGGDNSNTQFALLGIWAAGRHGFDSNAALEAIDDHFRQTHDSEGRWGYRPGEAPRPSMTCAGLMGLAIASARPALAERQNARARGAALAADPEFTAALRAVSSDAREIDRGSDIYYIWSLERVCVALGLRDLDGFDWYAAGAAELLGRQQADGGWPQAQWGRLPNTCLALLFLRKANLAFELDRVLKLPGASRPVVAVASAATADPEPPAEQGKAAEGDAMVVVTGANDSNFPEIAVDFEVKRPDGSFLLDGTKDDFKVTENGEKVEILRLQAPTAREARPITVVLVVDRSRSMEEDDRIGGLKRAVGTFLKGLPQGSRVAVIAFGSEVERISEFTDDFGKLDEAVNRLTPAGATRYYDAVAEALDLLSRETGRRAVLALTDGEDTFSQTATLESVIASARKLGLPVHTLGLGSEDEIESDALRKLAEATRGQYYPARQADQLRTIYEQLAERLRSSYTLVYQTDRKIPDGTLRPVRVVYRASKQAGETAVFIPGMVVPAAGWSWLFIGLVLALVLLACVPGRLSRRGP
jgi:VWFA-related protein